MAGEKGEPLEEVLESAYTVMLKFVQLISYYSPIGLGCYFAVLVGTFGGQIALGYAKTFVIYTLVSIVYYVVAYSLICIYSRRKERRSSNVEKHCITNSCSFSNMFVSCCNSIKYRSCKRIGVSGDIAETTVPLGIKFS